MKQIFLLLLLFMFSTTVISAPLKQSKPSIFIDPSIGYLMGSTKENGRTSNYSGVDLGFKGGMKYWGFFGGLDFNWAFTTRKANGFLPQDNYQERNFGVLAGYEAPFRLRAWGTFVFSSAFEDSPGNIYKGNGFKLGAGYSFKIVTVPIGLNLEYQMLTFDELKMAGMGNTALNGSQQLETNAIIFTVSIPWDIPLSL